MWHNYGFDRHVMFNSPDGREEQKIDCRGFAGDTMHMARLWDTSMEKISGDTGFSLEALTVKLLGELVGYRGVSSARAPWDKQQKKIVRRWLVVCGAAQPQFHVHVAVHPTLP